MSESIRFGEADLNTCDREPIHIPGSIQPHGVLLVADRQGLSIEQAAGDTLRLLGVDLERVTDMSVAELFDADSAAFIGERLNTTAPFVAPMTRLGIYTRVASGPLDLTLHARDRTVVLELEPARRTVTSAGDPIAQLKTLLSVLQVMPSVDESCAAAATALRAATGFDRAMVYRFLPDDSGMVVAEDARSDLESFLGLHYPASDIPQQARELYRRNWLRTITDVDYVPAPLTPTINRRTRQAIDMSYCALRSVSPIHIEYLRNMGVSASLSASIVCRDRLWGMLVLHHYSARHVSADLRIACETFAQIFSLHIEAKTQTELSMLRLNARQSREQLIGLLADAEDIGAAIASWDLRQYLDASGAAVFLDGRLHCIGVTPAAPDIEAIITWLNGINRPLFSSAHLAAEYPPAARFPSLASGMVAIGLSRTPRDYVLWFRPEIGRTVRWAGEPAKSVKLGPLGSRLTPRGSFAEWLEVTKMQAAPWSEVELEAAESVRVLMLETVLKNIARVQREQAYAATRAMAEELELRVTERTQQLRALASDLEAAEERERRQIARDLHDNLGQTLAAARIRLSDLCRHSRSDVRTPAIQVGELIDRATDSTRSLAAQLAPEILHELGLNPALEWLGEEIGSTFGLTVTVVDDGQPKDLSHELRSILYRAVRELLINVAKHAGTDLATIESVAQDGRVVIRVTDRGVGFDPTTVSSRPGRGLGLVTLRERLSLIGGTATLHSAPGSGTTAVLSAPLAAATAPSAARDS